MNTTKELVKKPVSENGKASTATSPLSTVKTEPIPTGKKQNEDGIPSLDERLHRLNQLFELQTKYNKLQESLHKLNEFEIKKDGERSHLSISDDKRNDFTTYHPDIIKEVTDFLKSRIKEKIKAIEPQLKW